MSKWQKCHLLSLWRTLNDRHLVLCLVVALGLLTRNGKIYYYHGKPLTEKEMVVMIQQDCEQAYHYYKKQTNITVSDS